MSILAACVWIGAAATGKTNGAGIQKLQEEGWLFTVSLDMDLTATLTQMNYFHLFDFPKVQWSALTSAAQNIVLLVLIGILNLPIAIAALAQTLDTTSVNVERELLGSAAANILSGAMGSVPNLIVSIPNALFQIFQTDGKGLGFLIY